MIRRWSFGVGVFLVGTMLTLAAERAEEVLEKVREKYEAMRDARISFSQKTTFELSSVEHDVSGVLYLKKENKYRIETGDQTIVTDGETVWKYSSAQHQVLVDRFKADGRTFSPERVLGGAPSGFVPTLLGTERVGKTETVVLKLTASDEDSFVRTIKLWVDDGTWLIKKAEYTDVGGTRTEYSVTDFKTDVGLDDARFRYQIPEGVDVVDLR